MQTSEKPRYSDMLSNAPDRSQHQRASKDRLSKLQQNAKHRLVRCIQQLPLFVQEKRAEYGLQDGSKPPSEWSH